MKLFAIALIVIVLLSGCAFTMSTYPVDHTELTQSQSDVPLYCHFFTCRGEQNEK